MLEAGPEQAPREGRGGGRARDCRVRGAPDLARLWGPPFVEAGAGTLPVCPMATPTPHAGSGSHAQALTPTGHISQAPLATGCQMGLARGGHQQTSGGWWRREARAFLPTPHPLGPVQVLAEGSSPRFWQHHCLPGTLQVGVLLPTGLWLCLKSRLWNCPPGTARRCGGRRPGV